MPFKPTDEQQAILDHDHGDHARVLAGPGTGKSSTVVAYMEQLLQGTPTPSIRLLTFTRAATTELAQKIAAAAGVEAIRPSTVHSFAIAVLLANGGVGSFPEPLRLADDWENDNIVLPSLARHLGSTKRKIQQHIKEMASAWESLDEAEDSEFTPAEKAQFLGVWNEHRTILGYTLLGELPYRLLEALRSEVDLKRCSFDLLIVDEYQDLNSCDLEMIRLISEQYGCRVLGIGDDDQSIYSFRSAAPQGIRRFQSDYAAAADYPLSVTLRCGRRIIEWANHVIHQNTDRPKDRGDLQPGPDNPDGEVALYSFRTNVQEAAGIAKLIQDLIDERDFAPSDILCLLRGDHNKGFSKPIKEALDSLGIPYADPTWVDELLEEPSNRQFLALTRLMINQEDSLAWATLLMFSHGIGDAFFDKVYDTAREKNKTYASTLLDQAKKNFAGYPGQQGRKAAQIIKSVLEYLNEIEVPSETPDGGWTQWLKNQAKLPCDIAASLKFFELLTDIEALLDDDIELGRFLNQLAPLGKDIANAQADGVRIMTMASSKGLTVRATIIAGCEDGIIPKDGQNRSEEARLLYVAMTRAKEILYCTWARKRVGQTAHVGRSNVGKPRRRSGFFEGGPVSSSSGDDLLL